MYVKFSNNTYVADEGFAWWRRLISKNLVESMEQFCNYEPLQDFFHDKIKTFYQICCTLSWLLDPYEINGFYTLSTTIYNYECGTIFIDDIDKRVIRCSMCFLFKILYQSTLKRRSKRRMILNFYGRTLLITRHQPYFTHLLWENRNTSEVHNSTTDVIQFH